ncbi:hypothetical protein ENBRE01_2185, partial [Enteropsectra breve]
MNFRQTTLDAVLQEVMEFKDFKCTRCMSKAVLLKGSDFRQICTWKECKYRESIVGDSPFYHCRISKNDVLKIIWLWSEGVKKKTISKIVEVSRQTVSSIIKRMKNKIID